MKGGPGASGRVLPPVTGRSRVRVAVSLHCTSEGKACHWLPFPRPRTERELSALGTPFFNFLFSSVAVQCLLDHSILMCSYLQPLYGTFECTCKIGPLCWSWLRCYILIWWGWLYGFMYFLLGNCYTALVIYELGQFSQYEIGLSCLIQVKVIE